MKFESMPLYWLFSSKHLKYEDVQNEKWLVICHHLANNASVL